MRTATLPPYTLCPRLEPRGSASATGGKAVVSISWAAGYRNAVLSATNKSWPGAGTACVTTAFYRGLNCNSRLRYVAVTRLLQITYSRRRSCSRIHRNGEVGGFQCECFACS